MMGRFIESEENEMIVIDRQHRTGERRRSRRKRNWTPLRFSHLAEIIAAGVLALSLAPGTCHAECPPRYEVTLLHHVDICPQYQTVITVRAMNDDGLIVGDYVCFGSANNRPWTWDQTTLDIQPIPLGVLGGPAFAWDVNNEGVTVGTLAVPGDPLASWHGYAFDGDDLSVLLSPGEGEFDFLTCSSAHAVSNTGIIAGIRCSSSKELEYVPAYWIDPLDPVALPSGGGPTSLVRAINDAGTMVGRARNQESGTSFAAVWQDDQLTLIPPLAGFDRGEAKSINANGDVVGVSFVLSGGLDQRGFIWKDGSLDGLGLPAGASTLSPRSINDDGIVVGNSNSPRRPFVWKDGRIYGLRDLLLPGQEDLPLTSAAHVDHAGRIVGNAGDSKIYIATPVPPVVGDLTCDREVGFVDLVRLLAVWGDCAAACDGDLDESGAVDHEDLQMLLDNWGGAAP